jgi:hypothetical protein
MYFTAAIIGSKHTEEKFVSVKNFSTIAKQNLCIVKKKQTGVKRIVNSVKQFMFTVKQLLAP